MLSLFLLATLLIFTVPTRAVLINTFDNCLRRDVRLSPTHLQFHPLLVAVSFSLDDPDKILTVRVWGNVTGESSANPSISRRDLFVEGDALYLPRSEEGWSWWEKRQDATTVVSAKVNGTDTQIPAGSWGQIRVNNPTINGSVDYETNGTIVDKDASWSRYATTFKSTIGIASFSALNDIAFFCADSSHGSAASIGATCPMGNVKLSNQTDYNNITLLMNELDSFTYNTTLISAYRFATLDTRFTIISGDNAATTVGCVHIEITPLLGTGISAAITWVPAGLLALVALGTVLAAILNPWVGTVDIFRWSSNFGMDEDMIRLVTPGFADCLQWLQFFVLTGSLSLNYPGFYQPTIARLAWSTLLFNTSFFTHEPISDQSWSGDGIYALDAAAYGLERIAQAVGLQDVNDIWVCMAAWFAVVAVGTIIVVQVWFGSRWVIRTIRGVEEEDLTQKNVPFTLGLINRITFTYFLTPILAISAFQITVASHTSTAVVACAGVTIFVVLTTAIALTIRIWNHKPRSTLFDNLPTLLTFGTFYNTYREKNLKFFIVQLYVNIVRALAFGALQPSGIAQITILAICEIVLVLTIYGIKPYAPATSMNAWQAIFAMIRLLTILLMMTFVPSMDAGGAARAWIGYVILVIHALVLIFGFFFMAVQTMLELFIRGCGGADDGEAARGGLAKVFGMRQLSRRKHKSHHGSIDPSIMTASAHEERNMSSMGHSRPGMGPHSRSDSSAVLLGPGMVPASLGRGDVGHAHSGSGSTSFTPTTPGGASQYSYLGTGPGVPLGIDTSGVAGPYYRPPRAKGLQQRANGEGSASDNYSPGARSRGSWASEGWPAGTGKHRGSQQSSHGSQSIYNNKEGITNATGAHSGPGTPRESAGMDMGGFPIGPTIQGLAHRHTDSSLTGSARAQPDYAVREGDFYYGVRGPALSNQPARRLGTGPADPTGPVSNAKGWLWRKLGLGVKEDKGFTVVRSSRAPEELLDAEREAKGIGMAISADAPVRAQGDESESEGSDVESGDEEVENGGKRVGKRRAAGPAPDTDTEDEENLDSSTPGPSTRMLEKQPMFDDTDGAGIELMRQGSLKPQVPRKSSKRKTASLLVSPVLTSQLQHQLSQHNTADDEPDSPIMIRKPDQPYDPHYSPSSSTSNRYNIPDPQQLHPLRHKQNLSVGSSTRLPFTSPSRDASSAHSRSVSTNSSILAPPHLPTEDEPGSRPASVGTVQRYRMEDSLRTVPNEEGDYLGSQAELVEQSRSASMGSQITRRESQMSRKGV
ncbi:hypothetical protein P167DRAFT_480911 [Morchella conica CCBAS932]|uniref:ML-like domain-containing protein n=1 Tax=Morchella conica CCBAS932 TaxID=1392247 RepID=A0A3N4L7C9_9PEZI|nr:hypothetical protein P167DRAFT_480911 [Morchella conica CCBAS932]